MVRRRLRFDTVGSPAGQAGFSSTYPRTASKGGEVFEPINGAPKPTASADLCLPKTRSGPAQNKIRTIALSGYLALSAKAEQPHQP